MPIAKGNGLHFFKGTLGICCWPNRMSACVTVLMLTTLTAVRSSEKSAIVREIGERLRGFLTKEAELPTSIGTRMALLREPDGESPWIPTAEEDLENEADRKDQRSD